jgi:hypothetical protein
MRRPVHIIIIIIIIIITGIFKLSLFLILVCLISCFLRLGS